MADPRLEAILGRLGGGGQAPAPPGMPMEPEAAPAGDPLMDAVAMLEPLAAGDQRIAQAVSLLKEAAGGPSESPEDTVPTEGSESPAEEEA